MRPGLAFKEKQDKLVPSFTDVVTIPELKGVSELNSTISEVNFAEGLRRTSLPFCGELAPPRVWPLARRAPPTTTALRGLPPRASPAVRYGHDVSRVLYARQPHFRKEHLAYCAVTTDGPNDTFRRHEDQREAITCFP